MGQSQSLFIMNNWLELKLTECRLNYFGSVSWPVWQKRNWDHTFFSLGSLRCGGIDFCELEMQRDEGRSQIIDIWTLTKWPICLLGARLNLHFWIYEITSTLNWSFLFSVAVTVQHFQLDKVKRFEEKWAETSEFWTFVQFFCCFSCKFFRSV